MALDPPFIFTDAYDPGAPFDRDRCRHHCSCDVDFVGILVDGYQVNCRREWEWCLDMKRSVQDCVSGWNYRDARISPQAFVYLHAGAYKGALALARISRSARKHYISITPDELEERRRANDVCRIDIRRFHRRLRLLDANHLENFLCIFHTPLEAYAEFLEGAKLKKHNQS